MLFPYQTGALSIGGFPAPITDSIVNVSQSTSGSKGVANVDFFCFFTPKATFEIKELWAVSTTSVNSSLRLGIYNSFGNLITDCPVDNVAATGLHAVPTTPVFLVAGQLYAHATNFAAGTCGTGRSSTLAPETNVPYFINTVGVGIGAVGNQYANRFRTNAQHTATVNFSSLGASVDGIFCGVIAK
jgi:hypothetical protein